MGQAAQREEALTGGLLLHHGALPCRAEPAGQDDPQLGDLRPAEAGCEMDQELLVRVPGGARRSRDVKLGAARSRFLRPSRPPRQVFQTITGRRLGSREARSTDLGLPPPQDLGVRDANRRGWGAGAAMMLSLIHI